MNPYFFTLDYLAATPGFDRLMSAVITANRNAENSLDEQLLSKCVCEALLSGDFVKIVTQDGRRGYYYHPYNEVERLRGEVERLKSILDSYAIPHDQPREL